MSIPKQRPRCPAERVLERLREATRGTRYENGLYLVGGYPRDRALGLPAANDLDLMLEGDAIELAQFLFAGGLSSHYPVLYPRFGTAMVHVDIDGDSMAVELVSARAESYRSDSRKPDVRRATLRDDVFRRDFTINTLLENLHTGEVLDLTGRAREDLRSGIIRTPLEPRVTFFDDPLRMLRAIRFAARFGFTIEEEAWQAVRSEADRLQPPAIAHERIREEFVKIAALPGPRFRAGMEMLLTSNLLAEFLPQMLPMVGCTQNAWHIYDVWVHTLTAIEALPDDARIPLRLALLWHDVGKPATRTEDDRGVHFHGHPTVGADLVRKMMHRLKFPNDDIRDVGALVSLHMRLGEAKPAWADAPLKRLIRDCGPYLDDLFILARCDIAGAAIPAADVADLQGLRTRIDALNALSNAARIESPLDGVEIMAELNVQPGPLLREAKEFLINEVIDGRLGEGDKEEARSLIRVWWATRPAETVQSRA